MNFHYWPVCGGKRAVDEKNEYRAAKKLTLGSRKGKALIRLVALVSISVSLFAQVRIFGTVKDPQGQVVSGAAVVLHGLEVKVRTEQRSSETGRYEFTVVEAGRLSRVGAIDGPDGGDRCSISLRTTVSGGLTFRVFGQN